MKQRSRIIRPEFFQNKQLAQMPESSQLLFIGLWTLADRDGKLKDEPAVIGGFLTPYDKQWEKHTEEKLQALADGGFIIRYEADNEKYCLIKNFSKHQSINKHEAASTIPSPDEIPKEIQELKFPCHIYLMRAGDSDFYKVGIAERPDNRLNSLQTGSPQKLSFCLNVCLPSREAALVLEGYLLSMLEEHKTETNSEWFSLASDIIIKIEKTIDDFLHNNKYAKYADHPNGYSRSKSNSNSNSNSIEEEEEVREEESLFTPEMLVELFNHMCAPPLDKVRILRPQSKRLKTTLTRLKEHPDKKFWEHIYKTVSESNWLSGRKGGWKADFNWLLNPNRLEEIYEGKYDNNPIMTAQEETRHYKNIRE